jgi:hypothetical protein
MKAARGWRGIVIIMVCLGVAATVTALTREHYPQPADPASYRTAGGAVRGLSDELYQVPGLEPAAKTDVQFGSVMILRNEPMDAALSLLGPPDLTVDHSNGTRGLLWYSVIAAPPNPADVTTVGHVLCEVSAGKKPVITSVQIVGSLGIIKMRNPDPFGAMIPSALPTSPTP